MSKFFVGQRVRVVSAETAEGRRVLGREARITEVHTGNHPVTGEWWTGYGLDISPVSFGSRGWLAWAEHQLEPILPEGAAPSEFETLHDLLSSLEGVRA